MNDLLGGLLGNVLGSVMGGGNNDPKAALIQGVLGLLLNNNQGGNNSNNNTGNIIGNVLGSVLGGQSGNLAGSLGGLLTAMQNNGLGEQAASWQSNGANLPIDANQLGGILNSLGATSGVADVLGQLAGQAGVSREDATQHLTSLLPTIVDQLTPNGQISDGSNLNFGGLLQSVLGR